MISSARPERVISLGPIQLNLLSAVSIVFVWLVISVAVPSIFYLGYGAKSWHARSANEVNCESCSCFHQNGCWDGRFKGSFPTHGYKSMWFNMDMGMPFILLNFLVYAALASEMVKQIMIVLVGDRSVLSWRALIGVGLLLYPNFYSFWSFFNYINDRNWLLLDNQIFFGVSELLAMSCCVLLLDSSRSSLSIQQAQIWTSCIALSHFGLAVLDQWRGGYFMIASTSHQRLRDLFLLVPELVVFALFFQRKHWKQTLKYAVILTIGALVWFAVLPIKYILTRLS